MHTNDRDELTDAMREELARVNQRLAEQPAQPHMTTNLHDKMLAAIDAYFSASNEIEAQIAEEQLLDVRDAINKHKRAAHEPLIPFRHGCKWCGKTDGCEHQEPKIGCVNHDCDKCKAQQEPVAVVSGYYGGQCVVLPINRARLFKSGTAFYTTPQPPAQPEREWVGLTEDDIAALNLSAVTVKDAVSDARAVEASLKEKNA